MKQTHNCSHLCKLHGFVKTCLSKESPFHPAFVSILASFSYFSSLQSVNWWRPLSCVESSEKVEDELYWQQLHYHSISHAEGSCWANYLNGELWIYERRVGSCRGSLRSSTLNLNLKLVYLWNMGWPERFLAEQSFSPPGWHQVLSNAEENEIFTCKSS